MIQSYALFTFQIVAFLLILYLMHAMYRQLRRDASVNTGQMRADVGDMVAELRRAADQINADIASRASTLQKLVDEADAKLKRLDATAAPRLEQPRPPVAPPPTRAARPQSQPPPRRRPAEDPLPGAPLSQPMRTMPRVTSASPAAASAYRQSARVGATTEGFVETELDDTAKFQTVRRLAGEGLSSAEIARRIRLGREEVELIMQLATGEPTS